MAETTLTTPAQPVDVEIAPGPVAQTPSRPHMPHRRLFTADEYERMAEAGILGDEERLELIGGEIFIMSRIGSPHSGCVNRLNAQFGSRLAGRAVIAIQNPIRIGQITEPEPDITLAVPREDSYGNSHPTPPEIFLVIEVMDTSAYYDRTVKQPLYAAARIREVWLVDLSNALLEVYRRPLNGQYAEKATYAHGQQVAPEAFPDLVLDIDSILSRPQETP
jgi:Uma2 family endonuclease